MRDLDDQVLLADIDFAARQLLVAFQARRTDHGTDFRQRRREPDEDEAEQPAAKAGLARHRGAYFGKRDPGHQDRQTGNRRQPDQAAQ